MKKLFFIVVAFCSIQSLLAQSPKVFVSDSSKPIIQQQLLFQNRIIGKTEKGTVYALPQDNMPVLVPDSSVTSNMPNRLKTETPGLQMPNPYYPGKPELKSLPPSTKMYQYKPRSDIKKKIE
ncbi:hypothetical protein WG954_09925 [Lacibacter sp. H375]|uniref:hypothetical protein n=1 Tax=Lacibacter sp. H375 TaxID=3133424 RepID=UPI0030BBFF96